MSEPILMAATLRDDPATEARVLAAVRRRWGKNAGIWIDDVGRVSAISPAPGGGSNVHGYLSRGVIE